MRNTIGVEENTKDGGVFCPAGAWPAGQKTPMGATTNKSASFIQTTRTQ